MSALKLTGRSACLLLAAALNGCHGAKDVENARPEERAKASYTIKSSEQTEKHMTNATTRRLIVSKATNTGRLVRLGTLDFDDSNRATLSLEGSGPAVAELNKVWEEISKMGELTWKQSRPDEIGGEKVTRIVGEKAKPGDDNYIYAVLNTLERKYGYAVDLERR